jgi:hypothetical protein
MVMMDDKLRLKHPHVNAVNNLFHIPHTVVSVSGKLDLIITLEHSQLHHALTRYFSSFNIVLINRSIT